MLASAAWRAEWRLWPSRRASWGSRFLHWRRRRSSLRVPSYVSRTSSKASACTPPLKDTDSPHPQKDMQRTGLWTPSPTLWLFQRVHKLHLIIFQMLRSTGGGAGWSRPRKRRSSETSRQLTTSTFVLFPARECFTKKRKYRKRGDVVKRKKMAPWVLSLNCPLPSL